VSFGQVADAAAKIVPPKDVALKDPKDWKIVGQPLKRLDTAEKLTGKQIYGVDLKLPGMVNAAIKDCPVFGGKVQSFDASAVLGLPGVHKVVPVGESAVAVVADTFWHAKMAMDALPIIWDEGPNATVSSETVAEMLKEGLGASQAFVGNQAGDVKAALAGAARTVEAVYAYPHQNHACMEPMNATALYTPDAAKSGRRPRTARRRSPPRPKPLASRSANARCTRSTSAAVSGAAARCMIGCARWWRSPRRCRARRSSCSGRAKRTCCTAGSTRSRSASSRERWMRRAT
jgi:hypothetical protein